MKLQDCINQINGALADLGQQKAYDIKHPSYNYRGYCFERIVAGTIALGLEQPEDVPCWDHWVDRYIPGELFWKLWAWKKRQGLEVKVSASDILGELLRFERTHTVTVLGQAAALNKQI